MRCSVRRRQQRGSNTDGRSAVGGRVGAGTLRAPREPRRAANSQQNLRRASKTCQPGEQSLGRAQLGQYIHWHGVCGLGSESKRAADHPAVAGCLGASGAAAHGRALLQCSLKALHVDALLVTAAAAAD